MTSNHNGPHPWKCGQYPSLRTPLFRESAFALSAGWSTHMLSRARGAQVAAERPPFQ